MPRQVAPSAQPFACQVTHDPQQALWSAIIFAVVASQLFITNVLLKFMPTALDATNTMTTVALAVQSALFAALVYVAGMVMGDAAMFSGTMLVVGAVGFFILNYPSVYNFLNQYIAGLVDPTTGQLSTMGVIVMGAIYGAVAYFVPTNMCPQASA